MTVVTVNWNSLDFLRDMIAIVRDMSPDGTQILVVDNASRDGSREWLRAQPDVRTVMLPVNVGHGPALDLALPRVDTEFVAVLDVDAFPVDPGWLDQPISAIQDGAVIAGAHMHRNFVHPCYFVARTEVLHQYRLTFRPEGFLSPDEHRAPLFLDVGEALSQRVVVRFGGGRSMHFYEITESRDGVAGAVFGDLVYHNMFATQGSGREAARLHWDAAIARFHPDASTVDS